MTEEEKRRTVRVVGKRNQSRLEALKMKEEETATQEQEAEVKDNLAAQRG